MPNGMEGLKVNWPCQVLRKNTYTPDDGQARFFVEVQGWGATIPVRFETREEWDKSPAVETMCVLTGTFVPARDGAFRLADPKLSPVAEGKRGHGAA